jgi:hypothetical protein
VEPYSRDDDDDLPRYEDISLARPRTAIPKTIGILNIIFGFLLLLCVVCSSMNLIMQQAMAPVMAGMQQDIQRQLDGQRQLQLQNLQDLEKLALDEGEKAALRAKRQALQAQPAPKAPNFGNLAPNAVVQGYMIAEAVSGFLLNILMIVAGIGLLIYKQWARVLAIWVALLKIIRLIVLYSIYIAVVVPNAVEQFTGFFKEVIEEAEKAAPAGQKLPGAALDQFAAFIAVGMSAFAIGMIIVGVIYPIIVLILLRIRNLLIVAFVRNGTIIPNREFFVKANFHSVDVIFGVALLGWIFPR